MDVGYRPRHLPNTRGRGRSATGWAFQRNRGPLSWERVRSGSGKYPAAEPTVRSHLTIYGQTRSVEVLLRSTRWRQKFWKIVAADW